MIPRAYRKCEERKNGIDKGDQMYCPNCNRKLVAAGECGYCGFGDPLPHQLTVEKWSNKRMATLSVLALIIPIVGFIFSFKAFYHDSKEIRYQGLYLLFLTFLGGGILGTLIYSLM
jgi:hypothetical protein